jgi:hypothetical protein
MKTIFRTTTAFLDRVRDDLVRPHPFAFERLGFVTARAAKGMDHLVIIAENYHPIADGDYLRDETVGAMMGPDAIRKGLNLALIDTVGVFHVHMHDHAGPPRFSRTDLREQPKFVPDFFKLRPEMPHGAILLSHDQLAGRIWLNAQTVREIDEFNIVGPSLEITRPPKHEFWLKV